MKRQPNLMLGVFDAAMRNIAINNLGNHFSFTAIFVSVGDGCIRTSPFAQQNSKYHVSFSLISINYGSKEKDFYPVLDRYSERKKKKVLIGHGIVREIKDGAILLEPIAEMWGNGTRGVYPSIEPTTGYETGSIFIPIEADERDENLPASDIYVLIVEIGKNWQPLYRLMPCGFSYCDKKDKYTLHDCKKRLKCVGHAREIENFPFMY